MALLDGSLGGASTGNTAYGAKYGVITDSTGGTTVSVTSDIKGVKLLAKAGGANVGCENAVWDDKGTTLTLNLAKDTAYTDDQINALIKNAQYNKSGGQTGVPATIGYSSKAGVISVAQANIDLAGAAGTVAGLRATTVAAGVDMKTLVGDTKSGLHGSSDTIHITANTYGSYATTNGNGSIFKQVTIATDAKAGKETLDVDSKATGDELTLHLCTGKYYTEKDIEDLLRKEGYDTTVKLTDAQNTDGDSDGKIYFNKMDATGVAVALTDGAGVGKAGMKSSGKGLVFQIGANGVEDQRVTLNVDDMSSAAIGVANADVSTRDAANEAINMVDKAVKTVSMQRAGLGALQNRLEYTVNNLTTTNENLTNAESQIRDTDMATEMINYTKFNILQQASQAMLAQANQQPQAVLQLLG